MRVCFCAHDLFHARKQLCMLSACPGTRTTRVHIPAKRGYPTTGTGNIPETFQVSVCNGHPAGYNSTLVHIAISISSTKTSQYIFKMFYLPCPLHLHFHQVSRARTTMSGTPRAKTTPRNGAAYVRGKWGQVLTSTGACSVQLSRYYCCTTAAAVYTSLPPYSAAYTLQISVTYIYISI